MGRPWAPVPPIMKMVGLVVVESDIVSELEAKGVLLVGTERFDAAMEWINLGGI